MISECRPSAAVLTPNAQLEAQLVVQVVEEVAVVPDASAAVSASSSVFPSNRNRMNLYLLELEWVYPVQLCK